MIKVLALSNPAICSKARLKKSCDEVNPLSWTKESNLGGFTMTKFSFEDQLRAVNMYLRGYGSNTVAFGKLPKRI